MANSTPNRPGQNQGAGDVRALMLDLFGGEVITAFETATVLRDKHQTKTLSKGKSFKFPAIWRASGGYHVPGTEIVGDQIPHTEITVDPDDKLVSSVFIADIDELLNHYDVRSPYTKELGEFLARHYDANVLRTLILAARAGALFPGDTGGTGLQNAAFTTDANALIEGFSAAKQAMDEKDVPVNSMPVHGLLKPAQWYLVARSDKNLNRDTNGGTASVRSMTLTTIDDIQVHKSNIASGVFGADDSANAAIPAPYRAKFGTTVGVIWTPMAACSAIVQDPSFQIVDQPEKQGTLLISRMMVGTRKLRSKCAVELRTGAVPA
ncbi:major capsid protein [Novosphingobium lindaniclasticum]|uniref:Capsid protein n=1 Tax=Novosphingobium lindaniclasticum LE124 TaxID=1096930 RepID=T0HBK9_9SPHN|nr:capsid protein [Novosphingobium lindaniclasticum]EQB10382.1 capsid protein [Novosphingobium lindaniclasticum LE124]